MVDELEKVLKLAQSEREEAWREMAKQVAHRFKTLNAFNSTKFSKKI
jgi:nitrogen fixation/metabolism regulation signal transduction histidine kinase